MISLYQTTNAEKSKFIIINYNHRTEYIHKTVHKEYAANKISLVLMENIKPRLFNSYTLAVQDDDDYKLVSDFINSDDLREYAEENYPEEFI